jgi:arsenite methyltransferase
MSTKTLNTIAPTGTDCCAPSCCGGNKEDRDGATGDVTSAVREKYGAVAQSNLSGGQAGVRAVAEAFGYSAEELSSIPAEANMGLSCGNPTAMASLRPGEVVVDLGCGGGLDVFLAAQRVGPSGRAIGIDMTPEMIERAKRNAAQGAGGDGRAISNVDFHLAAIDRMPLADASVDVVISNCVINLAPDKAAVFREIARVLRPGGRVAVSDIALKKPLPPELGNDLMAYIGCIAGAIPIDEYRRGLVEAGLSHVQVVDAGADLNAYAKVEGGAGCCSPAASPPAGLPIVAGSSCCAPANPPAAGSVHGGLADLLSRYDVNEYAASVKVYAVKPA